MQPSPTPLSLYLLRTLLKPRPADGHKGTFGHALLIAGKYGMAGASILAARACLRSGVGKVTIHCPRRNNDILQVAVPEAIVQHDADDDRFTAPVIPDTYDAVAIGPGIGTHVATQHAFIKQLSTLGTKPLVLDADALNILSLNKEQLKALPSLTILTPHLAEYRRMANEESPADFARRLGIILLLKGHPTRIYFPDGRAYSCPWGNSGMATAGSGDVLTGILCGFLAQKYTQEEAVLLGAALHSIAGDKSAQSLGEHSVIASDIISNLPLAFRTIATAGDFSPEV